MRARIRDATHDASDDARNDRHSPILEAPLWEALCARRLAPVAALFGRRTDDVVALFIILARSRLLKRRGSARRVVRAKTKTASSLC